MIAFATDQHFKNIVATTAGWSSSVVSSIAINVLSDVLRYPKVRSLLDALHSYHVATYEHSIRVALLAVDAISNSPYSCHAHLMGMVGLLHDIGKTKIPIRILDKRGHLLSVEFLIVSSHTSAGFNILKHAGFDPVVCKLALSHHSLQRNCYPMWIRDCPRDELVEELLPFLVVADRCDALMSSRPYRAEEMPREQVRTHMRENIVSEAIPEALYDQFIDRYVCAE